jgi:hypothetical protein
VVAASPGAGIPDGLVVFVDRSELVDVVTLDPTGHAALTTSTLAAGLRVIRAVYLGTDGFTSSRSPRIYELVQAT